ncbi:MAG: cytochrome c oxidase subunit 3 [Legionellales bacterium]|jgi:cytochrome c oxidase subunit 3
MTQLTPPTSNTTHHYYVPDHSYWPIIGAVGLGILVWGLVGMIHDISKIHHVLTFGLGMAIMLFLIAGWFHSVIKESMGGLYSPQMDRSFRISMIWFIFSEVMFFAAFFGALFFVRMFALPWLSGAPGHYELTGQLLWPDFVYNWPLLHNPDPSIAGPQSTIPAMGIPLINTVLLLSSGVTVTWAHYALKKNNRRNLNIGLFLTIALAIVFLGFQAYEFSHAYNDLGLTLNSGIYGSTFFMLTGFHGLHVTIGTIMLMVILFRSLVGHFSPDHHFAFEATAWYWHFVDVVWVGLFIFVYIF